MAFARVHAVTLAGAWLALACACTPVPEEPAQKQQPVAAAAKRSDTIRSCSDLPGGCPGRKGDCAAHMQSCVQEPTHASLRDRGLSLTRCYERKNGELVDTGIRLLTRDSAIVLMSADPQPHKVACLFSSQAEWDTLPDDAQEAAFAWAGCTERTARDPFSPP
jgi:hypothetical protein